MTDAPTYGPADADALPRAVDRLVRAVDRLDAVTLQSGMQPSRPLERSASPPIDRDELAQRIDDAMARLRAVIGD